jgi:hypothetical protein
MNLQHVIVRHFEPIHQTYDWRDAALYALGLGMGSDPTDEDELPYVYEGRDQTAVPSMCVILGWPPLWISDPRLEIAWTRVLHGEQRFELHRPLPTQGTIRATHRVSAVADKGVGRGALLYFETDVRDATTNTPLASLNAANFLREDGGCGSYGTEPAALSELPNSASPDCCVDYRTLGHAALLYRLVSRDYMPIHADPQIARKAGFDLPISHGLNTLGLACRAILKRFAPGQPHRLRTMAVRFVSPALPGDTIRVEMFEEPNRIRFRAWALERHTLVLDRGDCQLTAG